MCMRSERPRMGEGERTARRSRGNTIIRRWGSPFFFVEWASHYISFFVLSPPPFHRRTGWPLRLAHLSPPSRAKDCEEWKEQFIFLCLYFAFHALHSMMPHCRMKTYPVAINAMAPPPPPAGNTQGRGKGAIRSLWGGGMDDPNAWSAMCSIHFRAPRLSPFLIVRL